MRIVIEKFKSIKVVTFKYNETRRSVIDFDFKLLDKVRDYACKQLKENIPPHLTYHNVNHTLSVVAACHEMGQANGLKKSEREILLISAWFHDLGHVETSENHEVVSQRMAESFLRSHGYPDEKVQKVKQAIVATKMPQSPADMIGKCLCDSDLFNLSQPTFFDTSLRLRAEWLYLQGKEYTDREWVAQNLAFLENHTYFTKYGKEDLQRGKAQNIKMMRAILDGKKPMPTLRKSRFEE